MQRLWEAFPHLRKTTDKKAHRKFRRHILIFRPHFEASIKHRVQTFASRGNTYASTTTPPCPAASAQV